MHTLKRHPYPAALILIIGLLHLPVILAPERYLLTWFNTDDAYYYFKVAQNVAAGHGFTFDGLARTNGFHPLWMFILIPIFKLPGLIPPLRALTVLLVLLNLGSALLLYRLTVRRLPPALATLTALAFSLHPLIHSVTTKGGLETGLSAFFILLLLNFINEKPGRIALVGLIAAAAMFARLDNIFLAYLGGAWLLLANWNAAPLPPSPPAGERAGVRGGWPRRAQLALRYFGPLTLLLLAYLTWNQLGFDTLTPVSGQIKRWWGTLPNSIYGFPPKRLVNYIGQFVTDDPNLGPWSLITAPFYASAENALALLGLKATAPLRRIALGGLGAASAALLGLLVVRQRKFVWGAAKTFGLIPLAVGCLFQIAYYKGSGSVAQREWYWLSEMLVIALTGGILLTALWHEIRNTKYATRISYFVLILLALPLLTPHLSRATRILTTDYAAQESYYHHRAAWLEANTEPGARIGMTGTGSSAYFTEGRTFVNLDGLINSYTYFQHMKNGTAHHYLADLGLDYVFGNAYILTESDPYGDIFEGRLQPYATYQYGKKSLHLWQFVP